MRGVLIASVACLALAGCDELGDPSALDLFDPGGEKEVLAATKVNLTSSKVQVEGPYGYCADPKSIKSQSARATVVFGNCREISGLKDQPQPFTEAVASVTATRLSAEEATSLRDTKALEDYLLSSVGRASLSRSGDAESIEILDSFTTKTAVYLRMRDAAAKDPDALNDSYWRSVFALPEAAVSVTVRGLNGGKLSPAEGLRLVREFTANTASGLTDAG